MAQRNCLGSGLLAVLLIAGVMFSSIAQAQNKLDSASAKSRVYLLTATYGVVAGSLTGLGSLAFYDSPSKHTRNIALGASIGLYVGLLLGAYMIYGVDTGSSSPGKSSSPSSPNRDGPVLEDPLRLDSSVVQPQWAPYLAYDEKKKSVLAGFSYLY